MTEQEHEILKQKVLQILVELRARKRYGAMMIVELCQHTEAKRPDVKLVLEELVDAGRVHRNKNNGGGIGRELYRSATEAECRVHDTQQQLVGLLAALMPDVREDTRWDLVCAWKAVQAFDDLDPRAKQALVLSIETYHKACDDDAATE